MEPRLAPLGRPTLMGPIGNLVFLVLSSMPIEPRLGQYVFCIQWASAVQDMSVVLALLHVCWLPLTGENSDVIFYVYPSEFEVHPP
jgi:hypothetical protein